MRQINCNECSVLLFETEKESNGAAGAQAQSKGFIYKNACLFSDKFSSLFFCCEQCAKSFYQKHIPRDEETSKKLSELKAQIPQMAKDCAETISKINKSLKRRKQK